MVVRLFTDLNLLLKAFLSFRRHQYHDDVHQPWDIVAQRGFIADSRPTGDTYRTGGRRTGARSFSRSLIAFEILEMGWRGLSYLAGYSARQPQALMIRTYSPRRNRGSAVQTGDICQSNQS